MVEGGAPANAKASMMHCVAIPFGFTNTGNGPGPGHDLGTLKARMEKREVVQRAGSASYRQSGRSVSGVVL